MAAKRICAVMPPVTADVRVWKGFDKVDAKAIEAVGDSERSFLVTTALAWWVLAFFGPLRLPRAVRKFDGLLSFCVMRQRIYTSTCQAWERNKLPSRQVVLVERAANQLLTEPPVLLEHGKPFSFSQLD